MNEASLLQPLESLLNRHVEASSRARALAEALAGRTLDVRLAHTPLRLRFGVADGRLSVRSSGDDPADAVIEGPPLSLAALAGPQGEDRVRAGGVRIGGDAEVARLFRDLFAAARPDFEEELSRLTGDVAAHHLARTARDALGFGRRVVDTLAHNLGEYLAEEGREVPARPELEELLREVDRLREDVDRFAARLARAESARKRS